MVVDDGHQRDRSRHAGAIHRLREFDAESRAEAQVANDVRLGDGGLGRVGRRRVRRDALRGQAEQKAAGHEGDHQSDGNELPQDGSAEEIGEVDEPEHGDRKCCGCELSQQVYASVAGRQLAWWVMHLGQPNTALHDPATQTGSVTSIRCRTANVQASGLPEPSPSEVPVPHGFVTIERQLPARRRPGRSSCRSPRSRGVYQSASIVPPTSWALVAVYCCTSNRLPSGSSSQICQVSSTPSFLGPKATPRSASCAIVASRSSVSRQKWEMPLLTTGPRFGSSNISTYVPSATTM